jgi:hypothetical protein
MVRDLYGCLCSPLSNIFLSETSPPWTNGIIKSPSPKCRLFFKIDLLTDPLWHVFNRFFLDWRYIHSCWLVFLSQLFTCCPHARRNYKDTKPLNVVFTGVFNRVYRLEIQSVMLWFSTPLVNCCPCTFSLTSPAPPTLPKVNVQYVQTVWRGGGCGDDIELCCRPYSAGVLHSVSD